jgi:hypothetical protein
MRVKYFNNKSLCYRIWEIFLAWSTIISRQGSATCYQIVAHKNLNAFDRAELISKKLLSF